jgi:hypothetical protein
MISMTKHRFGKRLALASILATLAACGAAAQQATGELKAGRPINAGEVLSGELTVLKTRAMKPGHPAYQITSEPRRLPAPNGLCNLETGPETFQLVIASPAQASQLKGLLGKQIAVKVDQIECAHDATQISEAVITKWSLVKR